MLALPSVNLDFVAALAFAAVLTKSFAYAVERWGLQEYTLALLGVAAIVFAGVPQFFEGPAPRSRAFFVVVGVSAIGLWAYRHRAGRPSHWQDS